MPTDLHHVDFDPEFREGARNAVRVCLQVAPLERAVLITDRVSLGIGAALAEQFREAGADLATFVLEDLAPRPLKGLPAVVLDALEPATVSCLAAVGQEGELHSRIEMTAVVNRLAGSVTRTWLKVRDASSGYCAPTPRPRASASRRACV